MPSANILTWLQENIQRLFVKSPTFFKVWSYISGALLLITGIPDFINILPFDLHLSPLFSEKINEAVKWASSAALFMSLITSKSKPVGVEVNTGKVVKITDEKKLPFTAAAEKKSAAKQEITPVQVKQAINF